MDSQPHDLFPEPSSIIDGAPQDILDAINVLTGGVPAEEMMREVLGAPEQNAKQRWEDGMLKSHESKKAQPEFFNYEIHVLDLSKDEDAKALSDIFDRVSVIGSSYQIEQTAPKIIGDSKAPKGYRAITIVKLWKVKKSLPPAK